MKGHEAFSLHSLLNNPFTSADPSDFAISYDISNKETIIIRSQREFGDTVEPLLLDQTKKAEKDMGVDSPSRLDISISSGNNSNLNHALMTNSENILGYLLKICFDNDKNTQTQIAKKIRGNKLMALVKSTGMFQLIFAMNLQGSTII